MKSIAASPGRRLLFVMNTPLVGGAERHTFELAVSLRDRGWTPGIFAMKAGPLPAPEGIALMQPAAPKRLASRVRDLAAEIRRAEPDLVVGVNERPVLASVLARRPAKRRVPIAAVLHSTVPRNRKEAWMQRASAPLFNRIEGIVFISANQREFWRGRGMRPRSEATIPNGIDIGRYSPELRRAHRDAERARLGFAQDDFVVGSCAVMRPEKNHQQLVEAVARLRAAGVPARALLVGDGPMRGAIEARAAGLGLGEHVVLAGLQSDVRPFVAAFDVGVLCSVAIETLSLAALEAMAMGVPMVMSDLGGASEIVDTGAGALFPVGDTDQLCRVLTSFADHETRDAAGRAARRRVEERFEVARMTEMYSDYLAALTA